MEFPILAREVQQVLRRKSTFFFAFLFLSMIAFSLTTSVISYSDHPYYMAHREMIGAGLMGNVTFSACLVLGFHAALIAAGSVVGEREKRTYEILATAPVRSWNIAFQKLFTPLAIELLLFSSLFPVLSLVFLTGGVSLETYFSGIFGTSLWILTATALGLAVSTRSRSSVKASAVSVGLLVGLFIGMVTTAEMLRRFFNYTISGWQVTLLVLGVDLVLFLTAANGITSLGVDLSIHSKGARLRAWFGLNKETPFGIDSARLVGPSWIFSRLESRMITKLAPLRLGFLYLLANGLFAFALFGMIFVSNNPPSWVDAIQVALLAPYGMLAYGGAYMLSVGIAAASLHRERDRDTAAFLLSAPTEPRTFLYGKWVFHRRLLFWAIAIVWVYPSLLLPSLFFSGQATRSPIIDWAIVWWTHPIAFVPLVTLASILGGLLAKRGLISFYTTSFFVTALVFIVASEVFSPPRAAHENPMWSVLIFLFYYLGSYCLTILAALSLMRRTDFDREESRFRLNVRQLSGVVLLFLVVGDWGHSFLGRGFWDRNDYTEWIQTTGRWVVLPLCAAEILWAWLASRPRSWWVKHLLNGS